MTPAIKVSTLARIGFPVALVAQALLIGAALGTRFGFWDFRTGLGLLPVAFGVGLAGALLSVVTALTTRGFTLALAIVGIALGLGAAWIPFGWYVTAKKVPAIHDISTDLTDPPLFEAVLDLRRNSPNPAEYGGREVAEKQRAAYPDVKPLVLAEKPDPVFVRALEIARNAGWAIAATDRARGRLEATDTTFWFGFKDDIVVRITPDGQGSRVDVRSVSRVGKSDVGTNAKRIEWYLMKLKGGR